MFKQAETWQKKFYLGISLKLFLAFWFVILTSVFLSYLVTIQFQHAPTQEQATPEQLLLLTQIKQNLSARKNIRIQSLQHKFYQKYQQHLIIKNLSDNKIYAPRMRSGSSVKEYLQKHPLENPVTIDFGFTKVTSSQPIIIKDQTYQLFVATQIEREYFVSFVYQLPIAIRFIFLLGISFLFCWLLAKSFSNPLIAIQKATEAIGQGKLTTRIEKFDQRSDEFGTLARSFNKMAEQLENNISAHQRLLGDVSHELRSPLTRLQLAVALAEKNMGNANEQQKHLTRCETEVDRLDEMIADVLTLSRLEHSQKALVTEEVALHDLIEQVINDCQYFANSKHIIIKLQQVIPCTLLADRKLLSSAISNVVNNAVKYSPNNEIVLITLNKQAQGIQLTVIDRGAGVPEEMITKLFSPFFRVADGRERSSGGTGLGLAIAQQAVHLHHGSIVAKNVSGGFTVTITLPTTA